MNHTFDHIDSTNSLKLINSVISKAFDKPNNKKIDSKIINISDQEIYFYSEGDSVLSFADKGKRQSKIILENGKLEMVEETSEIVRLEQIQYKNWPLRNKIINITSYCFMIGLSLFTLFYFENPIISVILFILTGLNFLTNKSK